VKFRIDGNATFILTARSLMIPSFLRSSGTSPIQHEWRWQMASFPGTFAPHRNLSTCGFVDTCNQFQQLGTSSTDQTGDAHYLTCALTVKLAFHNRLIPTQVFDFQYLLCRRPGIVLYLLDFTSDHFGDDGFFCFIANINHPDLLTIAHDCRAIADSENLIHFV
jgi:hypothetical protein